MGQLYDIFHKCAKENAHKTALISGELSYSYEQISHHVDVWASYIFHEGNGRPRVALLSEAPLYTVCISLALAKLDGCCIPTNPQMMPDQLFKGWDASDVNMVIFDPDLTNRVNECSLGGIKYLSTHSIPDVVTQLPHSFNWSPDPDFLITLSSGSTGIPKPIMISQAVKARRAKQAWDMYDLNSDDVMLCASPFFHSLGQRLTFTPLLLGATMVHLAPFTPSSWLEAVERHGVTYTTSVSSHLYALKNSLLNNAEQIRSLNTIVTSSAPIDAQFKDDLFKAVGCDFHEIYGATEVACASNLYPKDAKHKYSTVGTLCEQVSVQILDENKDEVPTGEIGEIAVKTPLAFGGYYRKDDLTQNAMHNGYFLTGDLGYMDDDGFLSYVSRKKDVIISGGINIYPADIEKTLLEFKDLDEVAIIGVEDDLLGEVIVAICIGNPCEPELRKIANQRLAPFQRPLKYFFVDKFPLTPSGKLSKKDLREEYKDKNDGWTLALRIMMYGQEGVL